MTKNFILSDDKANRFNFTGNNPLSNNSEVDIDLWTLNYL